jgi:DNA-binding FadR family transcriptional regulator
MSAERQRQLLFGAATGENLDSMKQALRLAYSFEHDLLRAPLNSSGTLSATEMIERFGASRGVGHEAIRILQHRGILRSKTGPSGGLAVTSPPTDFVIASVSQYMRGKGPEGFALDEVREAARFISVELPANRPGDALVRLMNEVVRALGAITHAIGSCGLEGRRQVRAERVAEQLVVRVLDSSHGLPGLRLGHEDDVSERFGVSRPVARQAIRILESQSLISCRRGRALGFFFREPEPGPLCRLLALWMLGEGFTFRDVLSVEHPLRTAMAMLALRRITAEPRQQIADLQHRSEITGRAPLLDVIEMEKNISSVAHNCVLDLLLRAMTVYKVARAGYLECGSSGFESYVAVNQAFLQSLFSRDENGTERYCREKNYSLMEVDLRCVSLNGLIAD